MATDEFGERTEQATDHRRREAREQGNVARSTDLGTAAHVFVAALLVFVLGMPTVKGLAEFTAASLSAPAWTGIDQGLLLRRLRDDGETVAGIVLPWLLALAAATVLVNVAQVGFLVTPDVVQPKWSRIDPVAGFQRLFSWQAVVRLGISLAKLAALSVVAFWFAAAEMPGLLRLVGAAPPAILAETNGALGRLGLVLGGALLGLAVLDLLWQRWKFDQDLRMTKQEVREELKTMEGDPHIRARRRDAHRKLAAARELQQVKTADFVLTNPTHYSVAVKYDARTMPAPVVVAKGVDDMALRIRQIARDNGVPLVERPELARALYRDVKVGQAIPLEMYEVFVELLAYVYRLTGRTPPGLT